MNEVLDLPQHDREQVVNGFRKFVERGVTNPDDLDRKDPEVAKVYNLLDAWVKQEEEKAKKIGTPEAFLAHKFEIYTVEVDAGFSDPDYLDELVNDWLASDEQDAQDLGLVELAAKIRAKAREINKGELSW